MRELTKRDINAIRIFAVYCGAWSTGPSGRQKWVVERRYPHLLEPLHRARAAQVTVKAIVDPMEVDPE